MCDYTNHEEPTIASIWIREKAKKKPVKNNIKIAGIFFITLFFLINTVSPQKIASTTVYYETKYLRPEPTIIDLPQRQSDVLVNPRIVDTLDKENIIVDYNADKVFNELSDNTWICSNECWAEFWVYNKETIRPENLGVEFYEDDYTFKKPSNDISFSTIVVREEEDKEWVELEKKDTLVKGWIDVKVLGVKERNVDVAWRPVIYYDNVTVLQNRWALWKKGEEISPTTNSNLIAAWHMEETSGNLIDYTGNSHTLYPIDSPLYSQTGYLGNGVGFQGLSTQVFNSSSADFKLSTFTITQWLKPYPNKAGYLNSFASFTGSTQKNGCYSYSTGTYANSTLNVFCSDGVDWRSITSTGRFNPGVYNFFSYSRYNSSGSCYHIVCVNSVCDSNACSYPLVYGSTGSFSIGRGDTYATDSWNGSIDETRFYNTNLSITQMMDIMNNTYPIAGYHLNEASGNVLDFSGNGYSLVNNGATQNQVGVFNKSASFDGVNDFLNSTSAGYHSPSGNVASWGGWVKHSGANMDSVRQPISNKGYNYYHFYLGSMETSLNTRCLFSNSSNTNNILDGSVNIRNGAWNHVLCVINGTHIILYVNGTYVTSNSWSGNINTETDGRSIFTIGTDFDEGGSGYWNGSIDEYAVWGRALSSTEVNNLYEAGITQSNWINPSNFTSLTQNQIVTANASIGFADQTVSNITFTNISGQTIVLMSNGVSYNQTALGYLVDKVNATHWSVSANLKYDYGGYWKSTLKSCGGNGLVTCDTKDIWINVLAAVHNVFPTNLSVLQAPITFSCNFTCGNLNPPAFITTQVGLNIYNSTSEVVFSNTTSCYDYCNQVVTWSVALDDGNYSYVCNASYGEQRVGIPEAGLGCIVSPTNIFDAKTYFNITNPIVNIFTTNGDCGSTKGLGMLVSATSENWILFNLTNLQSYIHTGDMTNVWVEGGNLVYKYSDYNLLVSTTFNKVFTVWIAGYDTSYNYTTSTVTPDSIKQLTLNNFTQYNPIYFISIKDDRRNVLTTFANNSIATLKFQCINYGPTTMNLIALGNLNTAMFVMKEAPIIQLDSIINGSYQIRKISPDTTPANVVLYQTEIQPVIQNCNIKLDDYTGQYRKNGKLRITGNVNGSLQVIHSEPWIFQTLTGIYLNNNTDYMIEAYIPGLATQNFGWYTISSTCDRTLTITNPPLLNMTDHYRGLLYEFLYDESTNTVGFVYNLSTTDTVNNVTFMVYNSSNMLIHKATATTQNGAFSYVLPYTGQFRLDGYYDISGHSSDTVTTYINNIIKSIELIRNATDLDRFPPILGYAGEKVERFVIWAGVMFVSLLAGSANTTVMFLFALLIFGVGVFLGWVPTDVAVLGTFMVLLLVLMHMGNRRRGG